MGPIAGTSLMPLEPQLAAFAAQSEVVGALNVGVMWDRLRGEFLAEYIRLERMGLTAAELEAAMQGFLGQLSEKPLADLARRSSGVIYNQGRSAEILSQPAVEFVVYSSVLEPTTCEPCRHLDSEVFEGGSSDFFNNQPGAQCLGGTNCRCIYIAVTGPEGIN